MDPALDALKRQILSRRKIIKISSGLLKMGKINFAINILTVAIMGTYVMSTLLQNAGTFTVTATHKDMILYGLTLSETKQLIRPKTTLRADPVKNMWNITQTDIPTNLDSKDGSHNGEDYLAYTFYVKNTGDARLNYRAAIDITNLHLNVDRAIRVKIYLNGQATLFAKRKSDNSGRPEEGTTPFYAETRIVNYPVRNIEKGKSDKYTVVIWLEGEDPDCVNNILGGSIKMVMRIAALAKDQLPTSQTPS